MRDMRARPIATALGIVAVAGAIAGCGGDSSTIERVSFQADAGTPSTSILNLGGLTILGACPPFLSISARTAVDNAVVASHFGQRAHGSPAYTFVIDDFDRSYGRWDVLGTNPDRTVGTLNYSRPDGGQVSVTFVADENAPQGDCVFAGTAVSTP
jgi:hypothetical protein